MTAVGLLGRESLASCACCPAGDPDWPGARLRGGAGRGAGPAVWRQGDGRRAVEPAAQSTLARSTALGNCSGPARETLKRKVQRRSARQRGSMRDHGAGRRVALVVRRSREWGPIRAAPQGLPPRWQTRMGAMRAQTRGMGMGPSVRQARGAAETAARCAVYRLAEGAATTLGALHDAVHSARPRPSPIPAFGSVRRQFFAVRMIDMPNLLVMSRAMTLGPHACTRCRGRAPAAR